MESKEYELYFIAVPTDNEEYMEDMYNILTKHQDLELPVIVMCLELNDKETKANVAMKMREIVESGGCTLYEND